MDKTLQSLHTILIQSNSKVVWDVLTNPEKIAIYLFGTKTETDWKIGSPIVFSGEYQGITYSDKGIVMVNVPYKLLAYDYWTQFSGLEDVHENYCEVSYHLNEKEENLIEFTWQQIGFKNKESLSQHESGMPSIMEKIKLLSEEKK